MKWHLYWSRPLYSADGGGGAGAGGGAGSGGGQGGSGGGSGDGGAGGGSSGNGQSAAIDHAVLATIIKQATEDANKAMVAQFGFANVDEMKTAFSKLKTGGAGGKQDDPSQIELAHKENAALRAQLEERDISAAITVALTGIELNDADLVSQSIRNQLHYSKDGKIIVRDGNGNTRYNTKTGAPMTVKELSDEYLATRQWLVKSGVKGGAGIDPNASKGHGFTMTDKDAQLAEIGKKDVINMADIDKIRKADKN